MNIEDEFHKLLEACNPALIAIWGTGQIEAQLEVLMVEFFRLQEVEQDFKKLAALIYANHDPEAGE